MTLFVIFYRYHFVRTILSMPFCPIPFCPYTILSVPFCLLPFCPVTLTPDACSIIQQYQHDTHLVYSKIYSRCESAFKVQNSMVYLHHIVDLLYRSEGRKLRTSYSVIGCTTINQPMIKNMKNN